jgi:hypothetical protein
MVGGASGYENSRTLRTALAIGTLAACQAGWTQEEPLATQLVDVPPLPPRTEQTARLEFSTSSLPRLDSVDNSLGTQRLDMTLLPPRRSAVGLAVGMSGYFAPPAPAGAGLSLAPPPFVDVGVHWRHTLDSSYRIDVTAWRRMASQQPDAYSLVQMREPTFGARVELNLTPQRRGLVAERGFIGVQLDNGGRISIRRKHGGPMLYYRVKF